MSPLVQRLLLHGLGRKFTLFVGLILTICTVCLTSVNILTGQALIKQRLADRASSLAAVLASAARLYLPADKQIGELPLLVRDLARQNDVIYAYVRDADGAVVGGVQAESRLDLAALPPDARRDDDGEGRTMISATAIHAVQPVWRGRRRLGTARVGLSLDAMQADLAALRNQNLLLGALFLGFGLALTVVFMRRITAPLAELTASTEAASRGQFEQRLPVRSQDEIGLLAVAFNRMLAQLQESTQRIRHLAYVDSVTELPNRVQFKQLLAQALAVAARRGGRGAVLFLDLDRFKLVNDGCGHDAGDRLLAQFAERLRGCLRSGDIAARLAGDDAGTTVARLGGDEFTIILGDIADPTVPARVAERIIQALQTPFELGEHTVVVGTSIGIALFPDDGTDPDTVLRHADVAMYAAKESCGGYRFYSEELSRRALERVALERALRRAFDNRELTLAFQPQVEVPSGRVVGVEALLRWDDAEHGSVPPATFVPLAEETRLILPIGAWVLGEACRQVRAWGEEGLGPLRLAVNISAVQLDQEGFIELLRGVLAETGFEPRRLELEITETTMLADPQALIGRLRALEALGVGLAIDDFGTGHSSLSHLKRLPLHRLKIDGSFIRGITRDSDDEAIVKAISAIARSLDLGIVAEGVETPEQLAFLAREGCQLMQGHLASPPLPAGGFAPWLLDWCRRLPWSCPVKDTARSSPTRRHGS